MTCLSSSGKIIGTPTGHYLIDPLQHQLKKKKENGMEGQNPLFVAATLLCKHNQSIAPRLEKDKGI
jgi:hypothetical protein